MRHVFSAAPAAPTESVESITNGNAASAATKVIAGIGTIGNSFVLKEFKVGCGCAVTQSFDPKTDCEKLLQPRIGARRAIALLTLLGPQRRFSGLQFLQV